MKQITSQHRRAIRRAVLAWRSGRPHRAWEILAAAGIGEWWPTVQRELLAHGRRRYLDRMGLDDLTV